MSSKALGSLDGLAVSPNLRGSSANLDLDREPSFRGGGRGSSSPRLPLIRSKSWVESEGGEGGEGGSAGGADSNSSSRRVGCSFFSFFLATFSLVAVFFFFLVAPFSFSPLRKKITLE